MYFRGNVGVFYEHFEAKIQVNHDFLNISVTVQFGVIFFLTTGFELAGTEYDVVWGR